MQDNTMQDKPYPRYCAECGKEKVYPVHIAYNAEVKHDGKLHKFPVSELPVEQCENCHEQWFTSETDAAIQAALRTYLCLLRPEEIRHRLSKLSLSQATFANQIGVAPETVSRWLNGHVVQSRAMDILMRLFLGLDSVRAVLTENGPEEGLGVVQRNKRPQLDWVAEREFPAQMTKRRDSFRLRIRSVETHAY